MGASPMFRRKRDTRATDSRIGTIRTIGSTETRLRKMSATSLENEVRASASNPMDAVGKEGLEHMYEVKQTKLSNGKLRLESVDNWHKKWDAVLEHVRRHGKVTKLAIDLDGWLSARQVMLVAFVGDEVAAHICFGVTPSKGCVVANVVSYGIEPKSAGKEIESLLRDAAVRRAKELNCARTRGFNLADSWC